MEGTDGALSQMDDILVFGKTTEEHDKHLEATLHKLQEANLTLNEEKCEFSKPAVEYLGSNTGDGNPQRSVRSTG